jgi:GT2 family glycosyltransferase
MIEIVGSIVLYHNKKEQLIKAIKSFLNTDLKVKLYLIDNSSNDDLKELKKIDDRIIYIFNNANLGYGAAHNIAIRQSIEKDALYHVVLNPDIYFESGVLEKLFSYMKKNSKIGNVLPKVLYPDGEVQHLCKLLPTPTDLILRRFIPFKSWKEKRNNLYELRFSGYNKIMNVPSLSGCFMFFRVSALKEVGLFDEDIFMYLEDVDLNRRIHSKYETIFYPEVDIVHEYAKESYKSKKLLMFHMQSAIYYFNKWGWFLDKQRDNINTKCLKELNYKKGEE